MTGSMNPSEGDKIAVQKLAEALWAVATADSAAITGSRTAVYVLVQEAFQQAMWSVYRVLTDIEVGKVRDLLAAYGPHDSLTDTEGRGIESYVEAVLQEKRGERTLTY